MLTAIFMGYINAKKLNNRVNFLTKYLQFINYLEAEVKYSYDFIYDLTKRYCCIDSINDFLMFFIKNIDDGNSLSYSWKQALSNIKDFSGLNNDDIDLIHNFGNNLGKSDAEGQVSYCKMNKQLIKSRIALALEDKEKKSKLYFTLYILGGLSIILFFL